MTKRVNTQKLGDFLPAWVEKNVTKPCKELAEILPLWEALVPENARRHARPLSYRGGSLKVAVTSAAAQACLSACLRGGVLAELKRQSKGKLHRVKTIIAPEEGAEDGQEGAGEGRRQDL